MEEKLNKIHSIKKQIDFLSHDISNLIKNNVKSVNDERITMTINLYNNLIYEYNKTIDDYEAASVNNNVPDNYNCIINKKIIDNFNPKYALGLLHAVDNTGKSPNIPVKMSKWQF